jgi:hypothetical protein
MLQANLQQLADKEKRRKKVESDHKWAQIKITRALRVQAEALKEAEDERGEGVFFCANSTNVERKKIGWRGRKSVWRQF